MSITRKILFVGMLVSLFIGCSKQEAADVVYTNGKIYAVNEKQPWANRMEDKIGSIVVKTNMEL